MGPRYIQFQTSPTSWDSGILLSQTKDGMRIQDFEGQEFAVQPQHTKNIQQKDVDDMVGLDELDETNLMHNLCVRYMRDTIYTYTGNILVALNPYKSINIYGIEQVAKYKGQQLADVEPHIFALANEAFSNLKRTKLNQCVVISGESGAGKTEATKLFLQFLSLCSTKKSIVQDQIVDASPILEAFGNAKTVRNDNSSRFGKFVELQISYDGTIMGAKIEEYLLEKSRIVSQAGDERNYHIFYAFLAGASDEERAEYSLNAPSWGYLTSKNRTIPGIDDALDYAAVKESMTTLNFGPNQVHVFKALATVLHIGNITFSEKDTNGMASAEISAPPLINTISELLGVDARKLALCLTQRVSVIRNESTVSPLSKSQALEGRDALAKAIYGKMFTWIVQYINQTTQCQAQYPFVGLLDIFGFEDFAVNSFEQFCINYANERLQYYFNEHIFKMEQVEYQREGIPWENITFSDNQPCIDLISKRPVGLILLLDEESNLPKTTDLTVLSKFHDNHQKNPYYIKPRTSAPAFGVKHYAGDVIYQITGFLDKNKDPLRADVTEVLQNSRSQFIQTLFQPSEEEPGSPVSPTMSEGAGTLVRGANKSKRKPSTGYQFNNSLTELVNTLTACNPLFVRCIKPNSVKKSNLIDKKMVLAQLRYSGMLETIRIRRAGFSCRITFDTFNDRYRLLAVGPKTNPIQVSQNIVSAANINAQWARIGKSKVFLKTEGEAALENARAKRIEKQVVIIQAFFRMLHQRMAYLRMKQKIQLTQRRIRGYLVRWRVKQRRVGVLRLQSFWRGYKARKKFGPKLKEARIARKAKPKVNALVEEAAPIKDEFGKVQYDQPVDYSWPKDIQDVIESPDFKMTTRLESEEFLHMTEEMVNLSKGEAILEDLDAESGGKDDTTFKRFAQIFFRDGTSASYNPNPLKYSLLRLSNMHSLIAIELYKVLLKLTAADYSIDHQYIAINFVAQQIASHWPLGDEVMVQLCKLTTDNPNSDIVERAWTLIRYFSGIISCSRVLLKYLHTHVMTQGPDNLSKIIRHKILRSLINGRRRKGFTSLEISSAVQGQPLLLCAETLDGKSYAFQVDSAATVKEVCESIALECGLISSDGYALYAKCGSKAFTSNSDDHILDLVAEFEQGLTRKTEAKSLSRPVSITPTIAPKPGSFSGGPKPVIAAKPGSLTKPSPISERHPVNYGDTRQTRQGPFEWSLYMRKSYVSPKEQSADVVDLNLIKTQLARDIDSGFNSIPGNARNPIQLLLQSNDIMAAIKLACGLPYYFAQAFEVRETRFPFERVEILLTHNGMIIADASAPHKRVLITKSYDDLLIGSGTDSNTFKCMINNTDYSFDANGTSLNEAIAKIVQELKETSIIAMALCYYGNPEGPDISFVPGMLVDVIERDLRRGFIKGRANGKTGWFGQELVDLLISVPEVNAEGLVDMKPYQVDLAAQMEERKAARERQGALNANPLEVDSLVDPALYEAKYDLVNWALNSFALNSTDQAGMMKEANTLLKWQPVPLSKPMHKNPSPDLEKTFTMIYSHVLQYGIDLPPTSESSKLAIVLISVGLRLPMIRNEIYCYIMRQINENNNAKDQARDNLWNLLQMMCVFLVPDPAIEPYIRRWVFLNSKNGAYTARANECMKQLAFSKRIARTLPPTEFEIMSIESREPMKVTISCPDGSKHEVNVQSYSFGKHLEEQLAKMYDIGNESEYGLYVQRGGSVRILPILPHNLIADIISLAHLMVSAIALKNTKQQVLTFDFAYRRKLFISGETESNFALDLGQAKEQFKEGELFTNAELDKSYRPQMVKVLVYLAIIAGMRIDMKDKEFKEAVKPLIPDSLRAAFSDWEKLVRDEFKMHINLTAVGAGKAFLKAISAWKLYGAYIVAVRLPDEKKSKVSHLAVSPQGIMLLEQGSRKILSTCPYNQVISIRIEEQALVVKQGDLMNKKTWRYELAASYLVNDVICSYVAALLGPQQLEALHKTISVQMLA